MCCGPFRKEYVLLLKVLYGVSQVTMDLSFKLYKMQGTIDVKSSSVCGLCQLGIWYESGDYILFGMNEVEYKITAS